jgi:spore germination protein GerM
VKKGTAAILIILAAGAAAGLYLSKEKPQPAPVPVVITPSNPPKTEKQMEPEKKVTIYHVEVEKNKAVLHPSSVSIPPEENPMESALKMLFKQGDKPSAANPIPEGTRLLALRVKGNLATLDLNRKFQENFQGGAEGEGLTLGAICRTLAQFPGIKRVQILIEGEKIDTLGNIDLSQPLDVRSNFGGDN